MNKKLFIFFITALSFISYGADWKLKKNENIEKILKENEKTKIGKLILEENSNLKIKGNNTKGILIKGSFLGTKAEIEKGAILNLEIENDTLDAVGISFEGSKSFNIAEKANLKIKTHYNNPLRGGDIFTQLMDGKMAISVLNKFSTKGNILIESSGTGLGFNRKTPAGKGIIEFKKKSKSIIKGGFAGVFGRYNNVVFEEGSDTVLIGGAYGLMVNKGNFKSGSKVTLIGGYGNGKFEVKDKDQLIFEPGSEIKIFANDAALYGLNIKGKTKLIAKAHNVIKQIDTYKIPGGGPLDIFTFEKGSILDGNIDRSWNASFLFEEGTKLFVPEKIQANLELNGDLYVGPRSAYEKNNKSYVEVLKEYDSDAVAGATAIFFGKQAERAKKKEFSYAETFKEYNPNRYYTIKYNENYYNHISELKLNNSKIHLRIGPIDKFGSTNDKLIFSKETIITGKGAELILHINKDSKIKRNSKFTLIEEKEKLINGKNGYYLSKIPLILNDINIGPLVFKRKEAIIDGKYIISLEDSGLLTDDAKKSLVMNRAYLKYHQELSQKLSSKIFEKNNEKIKNNFWFLFTKNNFRDKDNLEKFKNNSKYVGYDYTTDSNLSLGFFLGESNGGHKDISQGIYFKKNFTPFYLGGIFKHTSSKFLDRKFYSKEISFITGYNKEINDKIYFNTNLKFTNIYIPSYQYIKNDLTVKNKKFNYMSASLNNKLGYTINGTKFFFNLNFEKELKKQQKLIWNNNIDEKIEYDDFSKKIGFGFDCKYKNHSFEIELLKNFSKYHKYDINLTIGYSYKF